MITSSLSDISGDVKTISKEVSELRACQAENENRKILAWLSPLNFWVKQSDTLEKRQQGTGDWLLNTSEFKRWLDGTVKTLWCPGVPGAGKASLVSLIINRLEEHIHPAGFGLAYIYCDYKDPCQTAVNLVGSLLKQFVERLDMPGEVVNIYETHQTRNTSPRLAEISGILKSVVCKFARVFIVIDALDECPTTNDTKNTLLDEIQKLQPNVSVLITSRPTENLENKMTASAKLQIHANDYDIIAFIKNRIEKEPQLKFHVLSEPSLQDDIIQTIVENTKGMFLLAQLQISSLARKRTRRDLHKALGMIPKDLNSIYDETMLRVYSQDEENAVLAKRVISWVSCARRPLKVLELQHALAEDAFSTGVTEEDIIDEELLVSVCAGLVTVDNESHTIRLVHYTAQEYFEQVRPEHCATAHQDITRICLTYLSVSKGCEDWRGAYMEKLNLCKVFPLLEYASSFWGHHLRLNSDQETHELAFQFLRDDKNMRWAGNLLFCRPRRIGPIKGQSNGLHVAAHFGLTTIFEWLMDRTYADPNGENKDGMTPLTIAASEDHVALVEHLLKLEKVDVNAGRGSILGTALHLASKFGHIKVLETLLQAGADVSATTHRGRTPLYNAAGRGHVDIVRSLLIAGSNARAPNVYGVTPLHRGVSSGSLKIVEMFLKEGGSVNVKTRHSETPLHLSVQCGQLAITKRLIEAGADLEARTSYGKTPLDLAVERNSFDFIQLLSEAREQRHDGASAGLPFRPPFTDAATLPSPSTMGT